VEENHKKTQNLIPKTKIPSLKEGDNMFLLPGPDPAVVTRFCQKACVESAGIKASKKPPNRNNYTTSTLYFTHK
jgi:hypothetical protein